MTTYTVYANDITFGTYEAESETAACEACARDAGYASIADMEQQTGQKSELVAIAGTNSSTTSQLP